MCMLAKFDIAARVRTGKLEVGVTPRGAHYVAIKAEFGFQLP